MYSPTGPLNNDDALAYSLLHSSIESLQDILIFSIDKDYRYLNFNTAFRQATMQAYGTEVAKGLSMLDSITDENEKAKARRNCDLALGGESHTTVEVYGSLNPSYFETRYNPIRNGRKEIIGVTILSANVTEKKRAEEQIRALNEELEAFSYSVAHDLRAPLRVINGYSGILLEEHVQDLNDDCQRILQTISANVVRMAHLIDELLRFSKLGKLPVNKCTIGAAGVIAGILEEQFLAAGNAHVDVKLGTLENLEADPKLIYHVFSNLISNAIKYSRKQDKPLVEISSQREGGVVTYTVKDNGVGFNNKYAGKLFQVFQRLHDDTEFEGTGVGLALVHRIVTRHGGRVWAEGEENKGATFSFCLPG